MSRVSASTVRIMVAVSVVAVMTTQGHAMHLKKCELPPPTIQQDSTLTVEACDDWVLSLLLKDGVPCGMVGSLSLHAGDLVVDGPVAVEVPPAGTGVFAEALLATGTAETLQLSSTASGAISTLFCGPDATDPGDPQPEPGDPPPSGADPGGDPPGEESGWQGSSDGIENTNPGAMRPCKDTEYRLLDHEWTSTFSWRFNAQSTPTELTGNDAETAVQQGIRSITTSRNSCGMSDQVSASESYGGRTSQTPDFRGASKGYACKSNNSTDGVSVVGFGPLPGPPENDGVTVLGRACTWVTHDAGPDTGAESDIRLNKAHARWTTDPLGPGCSGQWSVRSVIAHEAGHTFGLGHVGESKHGNLTMSPNLNGVCTDAEYTLGRGDVLGLPGKVLTCRRAGRPWERSRCSP